MAIEAFNNQTALLPTATTAAGDLDVTDSTGTLLANGAYNTVNSALVGQFSSFTLSNVIYGATNVGSATLTATINGVNFTGSVLGGANTATLSNGSTFIKIGMTAIALTNAGTTSTSQAQLAKDFTNTVIQKTSVVNGVNFAGTRLAGAVGAAATGNAMTRLSSNNASISNFAYAGNLGSGKHQHHTVQVNGEQFTATGVKDIAAGTIAFQSADNQC